MPENLKNRQSLHQKILAFQKEVENVKKDKKNPFFGSAYFDINGLLAAVKPALNYHGLTILQPLGFVGEKPAINTIITDSDTGENISFATLLPDNLDAQKMGSAITYYRRYAIQSFLGLEAEDDDGNSAKPTVVQPKVAKVVEKPKKARPIASESEEPPFGDKEKKTLDVLDDLLGN